MWFVGISLSTKLDGLVATDNSIMANLIGVVNLNFPVALSLFLIFKYFILKIIKLSHVRTKMKLLSKYINV